MNKKNIVYFSITAALFVLFAAFTLAVMLYDVAYIGPVLTEEASIGFSTVNHAVFSALGTNALWYNITEILGLFAIAVAAAMAAIGLLQFIRRKSIWRVDREILFLAMLYALVIAFYLCFEVFVINHRPVLIEGELEASYPSSHTMLALCIMATAPRVLWRLTGSRAVAVTVTVLSAAVMVLTVVGRLLSGVHWLTDIIGALLLSGALVMLYYSAVQYKKN
jgi:undecaprenyl-diphosphatase